MSELTSTRTCVVCGKPMVPCNWRPAPAGFVHHACRGLCSVCRGRARKDGTVIDHERSSRSWEELREELQALEGQPAGVIAERLGMKPSAIAAALRRHNMPAEARLFESERERQRDARKKAQS